MAYIKTRKNSSEINWPLDKEENFQRQLTEQPLENWGFSRSITTLHSECVRWRLWRLLWGRRSSRDCCLILASSNLKRRRTKLVREAKGAAVQRHAARHAAPRRHYTVAMPMASSTHTNTGWQRSKLVFAKLQKFWVAVIFSRLLELNYSVESTVLNA